VEKQTSHDITVQKNPQRIYYALKGHIDKAINFTEYRLSRVEVTREMIKNREIQLAVPRRTTPEQMAQIRRAIEYGRGLDRPVTVKVTFTN